MDFWTGLLIGVIIYSVAAIVVGMAMAISMGEE